MAINPINASRVSFNLRTETLVRQLQANNLTLFNLQQQLSTQRRLLTTAEDPVGAGRAVRYGQILERQDQIVANIRAADGFLSATDNAISDISDLLIQATSIASEQVNSFQSAEQRASAAALVDGIISQLQTIGNRQFQDRYLFAGRQTDRAPLRADPGGVTFIGDTEDLRARVALEPLNQGSIGDAQGPFLPGLLSYNLTAETLFDLGSEVLTSAVDLDPALTPGTRIAELDGAFGAGVRLGTVRFTEQAGPEVTFDVDFTGVDSVDNLVDRFNDAAATAGSTLSLTIAGDHLRLTSGGGFTIVVEDMSGGNAAADLGLATTGSASPLDGADLQPRLTLTSRLADLNGGAGLSLTGSIVIANDDQTATVSLAGATTLQDVLNRINGAGVGVEARINGAGTGIEIVNRLSGAELRISENGGTDATGLGIRSFHAGTALASLNGGRGVTTVAGDDIQLIDGNGVQFTVDVDGAATIGDLLTRINTAAGLAGSTLTASLATVGNGIRLSQPAGTQAIVVQRANLSAAGDDLGLVGVTGSVTELIGRDVNPVRASGVFTALYDLRDGLLTNDPQRITAAGSALDTLQKHVASVQGEVGARSAAVRQRLTLSEDAVSSTRVLLSEIVDVDFTEAVTKFQQAQTALQANLQTGSLLLDLSLLDFLR